MPDIRYDEHGRAIPVPNLADAARSFDGNWDADLRALDTEQRGGAPVSMREWLIAPGDDAASSNSKLEGLQEFSGSFEGRWAGTADPLQEALAAPRTPTTVNFEALITERRRLRAALRWFGLPVATHTITTAPIKSTGTTKVDGRLIAGFNFTGPPITKHKDAPVDWHRIGWCIGYGAAWTCVVAGTVSLVISALRSLV